MKRGHGRLVMAVMAMVMASLACSVEWDGVESPTPSMTKSVPSNPSMTVAFRPTQCLIVHALPGGQGGALNLRAGAGTSYPVVAVLRDGQNLEMNGRSGDWLAVTVLVGDEIFTGYVHADYVEDCEWK